MENSYTKWQEFSEEEKKEIERRSKLRDIGVNIKQAMESLEEFKGYKGTKAITKELDKIYYRILLMNGC